MDRLEASKLIAVKINAALIKLDMSRIQFAEMLGVGTAVVTRWLNGEANYTIESLLKIEKILSISLLDLTSAGEDLKSMTPAIFVPAEFSIKLTEWCRYNYVEDTAEMKALFEIIDEYYTPKKAFYRPDVTSYYELLKAKRREKGLTIKAAAAKMQIQANYLTCIETGRIKKLSAEIKKKLDVFYGL